jgi:hypothetical protein
MGRGWKRVALDADTAPVPYPTTVCFEALKQTAKVKSFLNTSANAVKRQIWTALIAMLILK